MLDKLRHDLKKIGDTKFETTVREVHRELTKAAFWGFIIGIALMLVLIKLS